MLLDKIVVEISPRRHFMSRNGRANLVSKHFLMESEEQEQLTHLEFEEPPNQDKARQICPNGCDRPSNVCLCGVLPIQPLLTSTKVLILHHPHERRHKLATVPIITKCLTNCHIIIGRRLRSGSSPLLDSLHKASISDPLQPHHAIFLFPGTMGIFVRSLHRQWNWINGYLQMLIKFRKTI